MDLLEKLAGIEARYEELNNSMSDPAVIADYTRLRDVGQERMALQPIVEAYREYLPVTEATPVDLFPHTFHVEVVTICDR